MENKIVLEDLEYIYNVLSAKEKTMLRSSVILITGCGGFLGYYFMQFFAHFRERLKIKSIIGLDNFLIGKPFWLKQLSKSQKRYMKIYDFNIAKNELKCIRGVNEVNFVVHMASIASPAFYRKFPLETVDANVWEYVSFLISTEIGN